MGTSYNPQAWNGTSGVASNATADAGLGNVESSAAGSPSAVDHWDRGIMAAVRNYVLDTDGGLAAGGTANAITLTTNQALSSAHLTNGLRLAVWATATNTSTSVTIAVDGLAAQAIKRVDGSALDVGSIKAGMLLDLVYKTGDGFRAANIAPAVAAVPSEFPSGTTSLFFGSTVPTGWVKDTTNYDNYAIRIVTGTPSSGGSLSFSTVFGTTATDNTTLTSSTIGSHTHGLEMYKKAAGGGTAEAQYISTADAGTGGSAAWRALPQSSTGDVRAGSAGGGNAHSHSLDLRVKYVDAWRATKS